MIDSIEALVAGTPGRVRRPRRHGDLRPLPASELTEPVGQRGIAIATIGWPKLIQAQSRLSAVTPLSHGHVAGPALRGHSELDRSSSNCEKALTLRDSWGEMSSRPRTSGGRE